MKKPKLVRDWKNGYVKILKEVKNHYGSMPPGTIFKVRHSGITVDFESLPCGCCGFKFSYHDKTKYKFDDVEWLGYDFPGEDKEIILLLKKDKGIEAIKKARDQKGINLRQARDYCINLRKIHRI